MPPPDPTPRTNESRSRKREEVAEGGWTALERDVLIVLALANEPASRAEWTRLVREVDLRRDGQPLTAESVESLFERFEKEGAIVVEGASATRLLHHVPPAVAFSYFEQAAPDGRLEELHAQVQVAKGFASRDPLRYTKGASRWIRFGTELRVAIVDLDARRAGRALDAVGKWIHSKNERDELAAWLVATLGMEPTNPRVDLLGEAYGSMYLDELVRHATASLSSLSAAALEVASRDASRRLGVARYLTLLGRGEETETLSLLEGGADAAAFLGAFWDGDRARSLELGSDAVAKMVNTRKHPQMRDLEGLCHALARVAVSHEDPAEWVALGQSIENAKAANAGFPAAYRTLEVFHRCVRTGSEPRRGELERACGFYDGMRQSAPWPAVLTVGLVHVWLRRESDWIRELVEGWVDRAGASAFARVHVELSAVLDSLAGRVPPLATLASAYRERERWEVALDALESLSVGGANESPSASSAPTDLQIIWEVSLEDAEVSIRPTALVNRGAKRTKQLALSKLVDGDVEGISERDQRVLSFVDRAGGGEWPGRGKEQLVLRARALVALVDHPHLIRDDGTPLLVSRGEPELRVDSDGDEVRVTMHPAGLGSQSLVFEEPSPGHVIVYERTADYERIARALGGASLRLPDRARKRVGKVLGSLGSSIRISAAADIEIEGEDRAPDARIVLLLRWDGATMSVRFRVAPLGLDGPHLRPGEGAVTIAATVRGRALRTHRDIDAERAHMDTLLDGCPTLAGLPTRHGEARAWDLQTAMEVLLELDAMGDAVSLAWPQGKALAIPKMRSGGDMRVRVHEAGEWLTLDVELPVDEGLVLGFRELLERRRGRFIELGEARFVALTEDLQRRIDALEGLGYAQEKKVFVSPVVLPLIAELTRDAAELNLDDASRSRLEIVERAARLEPLVPSAFTAELRDYQAEGFTWLARLAEAGLGACLADDMGLGKTVQALAVLVSRAARGPALVVAPTSVASNWIDEARRFAPSLRFVALATADRESLVESIGPGDVLVCSYGLLVTEAERLRGVEFDTVVFDEAHFLKNARTKRAKAARDLRAAFRLSLTGTPIENHLGELWSLMQATVPGLLGTEKHFEQRYAGPIREGDRARAQQLRALLGPFLLRRTKAQVLDELPPRTEVTIRVTPGEEEHAFYEALRRRALEQLDGPSSDPRGRFQILAQITRLRQAAVDPRLLGTDGPPGAKLDTLLERLVALRAEGHRALVFSQFLGSMELVRQRLREAGISYLSLDGSTPAKERAKRIAAFQDGDADVFVMSLKAGGVGVNLTGADYVIHLDPWWNPAVEDQATGRSHRIGQDRPVTVYRLVTAGTIEEKILALHRNKRELARDLLGQMDRAKKLDVEELRALL